MLSCDCEGALQRRELSVLEQFPFSSCLRVRNTGWILRVCEIPKKSFVRKINSDFKNIMKIVFFGGSYTKTTAR